MQFVFIKEGICTGEQIAEIQKNGRCTKVLKKEEGRWHLEAYYYLTCY